jgi:hypothetical protein
MIRKMMLVAMVLAAIASSAAAREPIVQQGQNATLDWSGDYVEAIGQAVAPTGKEGSAQGKLLAKRGAVVDLQRNLLEFVKGVRISSETTMENFMADDRVVSSVTGFIKNVAVTDSEWDGEIYTVTGRLPLKEIRTAALPVIQEKAAEEKRQKKAPKPQPRPKVRSGGTGLVLDCRNLPLIPSVTFRILSPSGKEVYGFDLVDMERFLASGLCDYQSNMNWAKGQPRVSDSPITIKPLSVKAPQNVDIVVSEADAARIAALPDHVIKRCRVSIVKR